MAQSVERTVRFLAILGCILFLTSACGVIVSADCARNVRRVTALSFVGPGVIQATPGFDFVGFDVTMTVEKIESGQSASACYLVRDDDPIWKLFWAVDDVLDANIVFFGNDQTTRTMTGHFLLFADKDKDVCGTGAIPGSDKVQGYSGEDEAEVYLEPILAKGVRSATRTIRIQK